MEKKINIFLAGAWGRQNFGDDILLMTLCDILGEKENLGTIYAFGSSEGYLGELIPEIQYVNPWRPYSVDVDIYLYGGGTQFFSFPGSKFQNFQIWYRKMHKLIMREPLFVYWKLVEKITRKKKFRITARKRLAVGLGLGPFRNNEEEWKVADELLKSCSYIIVRDTSSYRLLIERGRKRQVSLKTDLCYLLDLSPRKSFPTEILRIAFVVRDWDHGYNRDLAPEIMKAAERLASEGFFVRFVLFKGKSDKSWYKKLPVSGAQPILWEGKDLDTFLERFAEFDLVITSRFHGAVFSALLGIPFIAVEIEPKLKLVSEDFPESSRLWKAPFHASELLEAVRECNENYRVIRSSLKKELEERKTLAMEMKKELMSRIN